jgi:hypothetical protein
MAARRIGARPDVVSVRTKADKNTKRAPVDAGLGGSMQATGET